MFKIITSGMQFINKQNKQKPIHPCHLEEMTNNIQIKIKMYRLLFILFVTKLLLSQKQRLDQDTKHIHYPKL